jgi:poly(U)-binding-splicing factor PUF60
MPAMRSGPPASMRPDPIMMQFPQSGDAVAGPGVTERKPMTESQKAALFKAKKYAIELSLKNVIMKQSVVHQQQRVANLQLAANKERAMCLMCRIYIGSVYYEATEDAVAALFNPFGPLKSVCMTYDTVTGRHKGFCFLEYDIPEAAQLALEQMNNAILGGRTVKVGRPSNMPQAMPIIEQIIEESKNYNRVYVSSLHPDLNEFDVRSVFESFGQIMNVDMPRKLDEPDTPHKGYAFIEYDTPQACSDAIASMNMFDLGGQLLRVGKAITPPDPLLSFLGPVVLSPEEQLAQSTKVSKQAAAAYSGLADALKSEQFTGIAQDMLECVNVDPTDLADLVPAGHMRAIIPQVQEKKPQSQQKETQPAYLPVPDLGLGGGDEPIPMITIPLPLDGGALEPMVPPLRGGGFPQDSWGGEQSGGYGASTQPPAPPAIEFESHSLSAQEEISISGGGARQRLMQKLMRDTRTKTIVIRNMVTSDEVDEDLKDEINDECSKYGTVNKVLIYQEQQGEEDWAPVIVKIFVQFSDSEGSEKAVKSMHGRFFAGRPIVAEPYDQQRFDFEDLAG